MTEEMKIAAELADIGNRLLVKSNKAYLIENNLAKALLLGEIVTELSRITVLLHDPKLQ